MAPSLTAAEAHKHSKLVRRRASAAMQLAKRMWARSQSSSQSPVGPGARNRCHRGWQHEWLPRRSVASGDWPKLELEDVPRAKDRPEGYERRSRPLGPGGHSGDSNERADHRARARLPRVRSIGLSSPSWRHGKATPNRLRDANHCERGRRARKTLCESTYPSDCRYSCQNEAGTPTLHAIRALACMSSSPDDSDRSRSESIYLQRRGHRTTIAASRLAETEPKYQRDVRSLPA